MEGEEKMKVKIKSIVVFALILTMFTTCFSGLAGAKKISKGDKQVNELAEQLEFVFENAFELDENGRIVDVDLNFIERENNGVVPAEFLEIKSAINEQKRSGPMRNAALDRCLNSKLKNEYGSIISGAIVGTIFDYMYQKEWVLAAKQLIKVGVKGTVFGIVGSVSVMWVQCNYQVNGW
jgi:hypothetical protein